MSTECAEQFTLFDIGIDLSRARLAREKFMEQAKAFNTVKGYAHSWKVFESWCRAAGRTALPSSPDTVSLFVSWAVDERGYRLANVRHILSAISDRHETGGLPSPVDAGVRAVVSAAARALAEEPHRKDALTPDQLASACSQLDDTAKGLRDRAILLFAFASGWRRSEIASLALSSVRFSDDGLTVKLGKSKTDQEAKGRESANLRLFVQFVPINPVPRPRQDRSPFFIRQLFSLAKTGSHSINQCFAAF